MASSKSYADILKDARKPPGAFYPPLPQQQQQQQAPASGNNKKGKADSHRMVPLGPKPSPLPSASSPSGAWAGPSWSSVLRGVKGAPAIPPDTLPPLPPPSPAAPASTAPESAPPAVAEAAAPKPTPQQAPKPTKPTKKKKQQQQPPPLAPPAPPANVLLVKPIPARTPLPNGKPPQNTKPKTKPKPKNKAKMKAKNKETVRSQPAGATHPPRPAPCPTPPPPPESPGGLSSAVSMPWTPSSNQSQSQTASSAQHAPFAHLWADPRNADVQIECKGLVWRVHRHVLVAVSDWMEKHIPPPQAAGSSRNELVVWNLDKWHPGILSAVLQYTYLEDYPGGDYSPREPFNTKPLVNAVAHFLAGTACLHRPLMEHTLRQIEHATREIQATLTPRFLNQFHPYNQLIHPLDGFSDGVRIAMSMTYDEPDQWRIRALRVVMGGLMAVAFPLLLQSPRWGIKYCAEWRPLRPRVVADHVWLTEGADETGTGKRVMERNESILAGYENMDLVWQTYRSDEWQPADDLMFPDRGDDDPADLRFVPPAVIASIKAKSDDDDNDHHHHGVDTRGRPDVRGRSRNRSRAIPIMRPDGTSITLPKPNEESPVRGNREPGPQGNLDGTPPRGKSASSVAASSRAQSWPRGPQFGFAAAAPPSSLRKKAVPGSPLKKCSTARMSAQSDETVVPAEGADDMGTRPDDPADDVPLGSAPQKMPEKGEQDDTGCQADSRASESGT